MNIEINSHFKKVLKDGIHKAPKDKRYVTVEVSSCHMSVFYEYYDNLQEIEKQKGHEIVEPQCYSNIKLVWDLKNNTLVFYDDVGMVDRAHEEWDNQKDLPKPEPIYTAPEISNYKNPLEKKDHYCQFDPGEDTCYFCGERKPI